MCFTNSSSNDVLKICMGLILHPLKRFTGNTVQSYFSYDGDTTPVVDLYNANVPEGYTVKSVHDLQRYVCPGTGQRVSLPTVF